MPELKQKICLLDPTRGSRLQCLIALSLCALCSVLQTEGSACFVVLGGGGWGMDCSSPAHLIPYSADRWSMLPFSLVQATLWQLGTAAECGLVMLPGIWSGVEASATKKTTTPEEPSLNYITTVSVTFFFVSE